MTSVSWVETARTENTMKPSGPGWVATAFRLPHWWVTRGPPPVSTKSHQFPLMATMRSLHPRLSLHTKDLGGEAQQGTIFQDLFEDTMSLEPNSFQIHEWAVKGEKKKELAKLKNHNLDSSTCLQPENYLLSLP